MIYSLRKSFAVHQIISSPQSGANFHENFILVRYKIEQAVFFGTLMIENIKNKKRVKKIPCTMIDR